MILQHELISSLKTNSERTAIEYQGNNITYREVLAASEKIMDILLKDGLQKEATVGILVTSKADLIYAMTGVLNAGGSFLLIDATWPVERMATIMTDTDLKYLISSRDLQPLIPEQFTESRYLLEDVLAQGAPVNPIPYPEYNEEDSIYVYYTSGSTGTPKGIIGKNCSLLQFIKWEIATFHITNETRVSQFISPFFDAFLRDVFTPLLAGGTICIPPEEEDFFSSEKLNAWIDNVGISLIHCVPSLFRILNNKAISGENFASLKYILLSGEKIIPSELRNWYKVFGNRIQLVNLYGLTETTMIKSFYRIQPEDAYADKVPIGEPIWDTELLVAGDNFKKCGPLVPGDLYIITAYTTKGYLNLPELTSERFLKWSDDPADKRIAFKTGDKARILADGRIVLIGREDRQIKLRGVRIELDEIENVLLRAEFVKNVVLAVHTVTDPDTNVTSDILAAFLISNRVGRPGFDLQEAARQHLMKILPRYMVPVIVEVEKYPLLSSGKVNIKELLKLLSVKDIVGPEDETETRMLKIWQEILGNKPISTQDSFHRIGGDSLAMMSLIGKIQREFNVRIALHELFSNMTIRQQAQLIKRSDTDQLFVISKVQEKPGYVASSTQQRIYYDYERNKTSTAYNISMAFEIKGLVDSDRINNALKKLIARHESLRTAFHFDADGLLQVIEDTVDFELEEIISRDTHREKAVSSFVRPFDLTKAPLIRAGLLSSANTNTILLVDIHHIVCDGASQMILYHDFQQLYNGEQLPDLNLQYKDYAEWENKLRARDEYASFRKFWLSRFEGDIPRLNFPIIQSATEGSFDAGAGEDFEIGAALLTPVIDMLGEEDITVFSVLFSVFFIYMVQLTGQTDMVVGITNSGRMQPELEKIVGMFVKTLPIRQQIDVNMRLGDFIREMHSNLVQSNSNQCYDLADIVEESGNNRTDVSAGLFDVLFDFKNYKPAVIDTVDVTFSRIYFENRTTKYPLSVLCGKDDEQIYFRLEYMTAYFTRSDIALIIAQFRDFVQTLSQNPDARIIDLIDFDTPDETVEDNITFNFS